jgi:glycerate-2-kinase
VADARAIADDWLDAMDLAAMTAERLDETGLAADSVDVVALGKASREMATAADAWLAGRRRRRLVVADAIDPHDDRDVLVGDHPIPGPASLAAGTALIDFLRSPTSADATLFLVSGGASSLCAAPAAPLALEDLAGVWEAALATGADITTLNRLRASTSAIAGGAVLGLVRTPVSRSLVLVDNVVAGAPWVASGLTYHYDPSESEFEALLDAVGLAGTDLGARLRAAARGRAAAMGTPPALDHRNVVLAEPATLLAHAAATARRLGYRVVDLGSRIHGDVKDVARSWSEIVERELATGERVAVLGVGEVTVRVRGRGRGGRCQEFAWVMAGALAGSDRDVVFLARASDGRDFLEGVAGAWVDATTRARARAAGIDWDAVAAGNDSFRGLDALGQLIPGGHTGWNLCDLYVALAGASPERGSSKSATAKAPPTRSRTAGSDASGVARTSSA